MAAQDKKMIRVVVIILTVIALGFAFQYYLSHRSRINMNRVPQWLAKSTSTKTEQEIPKLIHQTYVDKSRIPLKVAENFKRYAPEYERHVYDDTDIIEFLTEHFHPKVLQSFNTLKLGAHKADLFRYCVLYVKGGIYMDIKTELLQSLDMFPNGRVTTVFTNQWQVYQGVIAAPPSQDIFLTLIEGIIESGSNPAYNLFILDFMRYIKNDSGFSRIGKIEGKRQNYYLLKEKCTNDASECYDGLDRYKKCCNIQENDTNVIKSRYADYPW